MLTNVPTAIAKATRSVVLRHPNSWPVRVWRKAVLRTEGSSTMGGAATMGGMGVLKADDEADIEYRPLGDARMLFCGIYAGADINERLSAPVQQPLQEAQVVCTADPGQADHFEVETGDLITQDLGAGVLLAYDVATITGSAIIPPFVRKAVLEPRDDLAGIEPFKTLDQ